jgi:hypothetical protein
VSCGTLQWSKKFLSLSEPYLLQNRRSNDLFGMHRQYSQFPFRNAVIQKLSEVFPRVGFSDPDYGRESPEARLEQWAAHKIHFIAPTLNDLPMRMFDVWSTGGIPLIPDSLRGLIGSLTPNPRDIGYYSPIDLLNFEEVLLRHIDAFDEEGITGIKRRLEFGLRNHAENRILQILSVCKREFDLHFELNAYLIDACQTSLIPRMERP